MPSFGGNPRPAAPAPAAGDAGSGGYNFARANNYKATPAYHAIVQHVQAANAPSHPTIPAAFTGSLGAQHASSPAASVGQQAQVSQRSAARAVAHVQELQTFMKLMTGASKPIGSTDLNPLGHGWNLGRLDMGLDANAATGTPIIAPNDSKVVGIDPSWYAGQPLMEMQFTAGPSKGKNWYVAERIAGPNSKSLANADSLPAKGTTFKRGQPVARYATSGTGIEAGYGSGGDGSTQTLAKATTGYTEGQVTPAAQQFVDHFIKHGDKGTGPSIPDGKAYAVMASNPKVVKALASRKIGAPVPQAVLNAPQQGGGGGAFVPPPAVRSLSVRGQTISPSQLAAASRIVQIGKQLHASPSAIAGVEADAIFESSLNPNAPGNPRYGGVLAGAVNDGTFAPGSAGADAEIRAAFLGGKGFQGGGAIGQSKAGQKDLLRMAEIISGSGTQHASQSDAPRIPAEAAKITQALLKYNHAIPASGGSSYAPSSGGGGSSYAPSSGGGSVSSASSGGGSVSSVGSAAPSSGGAGLGALPTATGGIDFSSALADALLAGEAPINVSGKLSSGGLLARALAAINTGAYGSVPQGKSVKATARSKALHVSAKR